LKTCGCLFLGLFLLKFVCFLQISVLWMAFPPYFMPLLLFQFAADGILGVFLKKIFSFWACVFTLASLLFHLILLLIFRFVEFFCQHILGLFFSEITNFWLVFAK